MNSSRKISVFVGILFFIGTGAGILSGTMTQPILSVPNYLQNIAAHETQWIIGALLVLVMGLPLAMVPVALFPILRKQNEVLAIGAVVFRGVLEAMAYILISVCFLLLLTVGQLASASAGASQPGGLLDLGNLLRSASGWIELLLAIVFSIGSFMINLLLFQSRSIPRWLSGWGLVGSLLYFAAPIFSLLSPQHPAVSFNSSVGILIAPLAIEEMVFAAWLLIKGFSPIAKLEQQAAPMAA